MFKRFLFCLGLVVSPMAFLTACGGSATSVQKATEAPVHACAGCIKGKAGETTWCDSCNLGFVNGKKTGCKACFQGKSGENVWCDKCGHGFVDGKKTGCKGCYNKKTGKAKSCGGCKKAAPAGANSTVPSEKTPTKEG